MIRALNIKREIKEGLKPCYVIIGQDECLKRFVREVFLATIPEDERAFAYLPIDINQSKEISRIIETADTFTFTSSKKMVEVEEINYELKKQDVEALLDYVENPNLDTFILFMGFSKLNKQLEEKIEVINCDPATEDELCNYINIILKARKYNMSQIDIRKFIRECNNDYGMVVSELKKLMLYKNDSKEIKFSDVEELTPPNIENKTFDLTRCLSMGDNAGALKILKNLRIKDVDPNLIFGTISSEYRKQYQIATTKASDEIITKVTRQKPYGILKTRELIQANRKRDPKYILKLSKIVDYLLNLEYMYKLSKITVDDAIDLAMAYIMGQSE